MRPIVGIICEYDPFHRGHRRQFELIREKLPDAAIVCLMSGCFTQRGTPALFSPAFRARQALRAGADMVLELPCAFSVRDGEHFALGGVSILSQLGFITHLSYGVEENADDLTQAAQLMENPTESFEQLLRQRLDEGVSFAAAQGAALAACLGDESPLRWQQPNLILALCYRRAMLRLGSALEPLPVIRLGGYHDASLPGETEALYPSATAVRKAYLSGNGHAAEAACGYMLPALAGEEPVCLPGSLDRVLFYCLRSRTAQQLSRLPLCSEGLEHRLKAAAHISTSREELLEILKTKRYARARLSRLCTHSLLGITQQLLERYPLPEYVRLLGFRKKSASLLSLLRESRIPVISKAADGDLSHALYALDNDAYDLWALGAGVPAGLMMRSGIVIEQD